MKSDLKAENELIRQAVAQASREEAEVEPFQLSGRGHEPRVTLDPSLAQILRRLAVPHVVISGYGANKHYPRRVFTRAAEILLAQLGDSPIRFHHDDTTVFRLR